MGRRKLPAGSQRTYQVLVRFRPHAKEIMERRLIRHRRLNGHEADTVADMVRYAVWEFCKEPNDPREA